MKKSSFLGCRNSPFGSAVSFRAMLNTSIAAALTASTLKNKLVSLRKFLQMKTSILQNASSFLKTILALLGSTIRQLVIFSTELIKFFTTSVS